MLPFAIENSLLTRLAQTTAVILDWEQVGLMPGPLPDADAARYVYFPSAGLMVLRQKGRRTQVALVGQRGSSGVFLSRALSASVIMPGRTWRVARESLYQAARQWTAVDQILAADNDELVQQVVENLRAAQRAVVRQRVADWLALAAQQSGLNAFDVTHDALAQLLGIRRSGVTLALHQLEGEGAIRSKRASIELKDRRVLEQCAAIDAPRQERPLAPTEDRCRSYPPATNCIHHTDAQVARLRARAIDRPSRE